MRVLVLPSCIYKLYVLSIFNCLFKRFFFRSFLLCITHWKGRFFGAPSVYLWLIWHSIINFNMIIFDEITLDSIKKLLAKIKKYVTSWHRKKNLSNQLHEKLNFFFSSFPPQFHLIRFGFNVKRKKFLMRIYKRLFH